MTTTYSDTKEIELLQQENDRLHHLTHVLIEHIWKNKEGKGLPLKEIDKQMKLFDESHACEQLGGSETVDYTTLGGSQNVEY